MARGAREAASAAAAVALACLGAESVRQARAGGSRRALGKATGIPSSVISDIEDASVLPSVDQIQKLSKHLSGIDAVKYADARKFGMIPWVDAIEGVLGAGQSMTASDLARHIASAIPNCEPDAVLWRLARELNRLEGAGIFEKATSGSWTVAKGTSNDGGQIRGSAITGRWSRHQITERHDPEHEALFYIETIPGANEIVLNRSHPLYGPLRELLDGSGSGLTAEELRTRLDAAARLMKDLLVAWAEYEDGEKSGARRENVREVRRAWGRAARVMARSERDDDPPVVC